MSMTPRAPKEDAPPPPKASIGRLLKARRAASFAAARQG